MAVTDSFSVALILCRAPSIASDDSRSTRRWLVLVGWLAAAAVLWGAAGASGGGYSSDFRIPNVESQKALDVLTERFPEAAGGSAQVVVHTDDGDLRTGAGQRAVADLVDRLGALPRVSTVVDPAAVGLISADGRHRPRARAVRGDTQELGADAYHQLEEAVAPTRDAGLQVELGGDLPQYAESPETGSAEMLGVLGAVVILLVAFGSVIAMGLPLGHRRRRPRHQHGPDPRSPASCSTSRPSRAPWPR